MNKALFIGRSVVDILSQVQDFPDPDIKLKALYNDILPGGSALNAAVAFAYMGSEAFLKTSLSKSGLFRDFLTEDLKSRGVNFTNICDDPFYMIPVNTVISSLNLSSRMIINGAANEASRIKKYDNLELSNYDLIQIDQYEHQFVALHHDAIRSFKGPVVLDGGSWKEYSKDYLRLVDIPIVSEVFCTQGLHVFAKMCNDFGITRWAVTRGRNGIVWRDGNNEGEIPASQVKAVDTLGAGDIFHGVFCHAFLETGDFKQALISANQIAGKSCETLGTRNWMNE